MYSLPTEDRGQQFDVPAQLEGLPDMKPEDQQYFGALLKVHLTAAVRPTCPSQGGASSSRSQMMLSVIWPVLLHAPVVPTCCACLRHGLLTPVPRMPSYLSVLIRMSQACKGYY